MQRLTPIRIYKTTPHYTILSESVSHYCVYFRIGLIFQMTSLCKANQHNAVRTFEFPPHPLQAQNRHCSSSSSVACRVYVLLSNFSSGSS